jgi:hypothetical protein
MRVKVEAIKRGNFIQSKPPGIIRCDPNGVDQAKFPIVEHTSVPGLVKLGLIKDPGDLSSLEKVPAVAIDLTGVNAERFNMHRNAVAEAGIETITPAETRGNVNFDPNQNVDSQAADGLRYSDPDAPPPVKSRAKAKAGSPEPEPDPAEVPGSADAGAGSSVDSSNGGKATS